MTELAVFEKALTRIGLDVTHKKNPGWASADRLIVSIVVTRVCFAFDSKGDLISISWGPYQDAV